MIPGQTRRSLYNLEVTHNIQVPQCPELKTPGTAGPCVISVKTGLCGEAILIPYVGQGSQQAKEGINQKSTQV